MRLILPFKFSLCNGLAIILHELLTWLITCVTSSKKEGKMKTSPKSLKDDRRKLYYSLFNNEWHYLLTLPSSFFRNQYEHNFFFSSFISQLTYVQTRNNLKFYRDLVVISLLA